MSTSMPTASYTARCEMVPMSALTASYTSSAVRWGVLETARSTASRCAVTLKPCCRRTSAGSAVISATFANLHPLVKSRAALPARPPQILVCVKISGDRSPEILTQTFRGASWRAKAADDVEHDVLGNGATGAHPDPCVGPDGDGGEVGDVAGTGRRIEVRRQGHAVVRRQRENPDPTIWVAVNVPIRTSPRSTPGVRSMVCPPAIRPCQPPSRRAGRAGGTARTSAAGRPVLEHPDKIDDHVHRRAVPYTQIRRDRCGARRRWRPPIAPARS